MAEMEAVCYHSETDLLIYCQGDHVATPQVD